METGLSSFDDLKSFSSTTTHISIVDSGKKVRYLTHRSFFAIIDLSHKQLTLKTYNIKLAKVKQLKHKCQNIAIWLTSR